LLSRDKNQVFEIFYIRHMETRKNPKEIIGN
jgi:hypothetical protein